MNATATRPWSHVSIASADLARSIAFYRALFRTEPVLERRDYARFAPDELGLVLGLNARGPERAETGPLQHLGILYPDADSLAAARARLARAGFATDGSEDTRCCYARLDQFWATDPSGVRWELFRALESEAEPRAAGACCAPAAPA
jgi:catechol 2,3-dioxygenase-like lactoylglutathione lyase family enzyme